jgi:SAM-dependent methyltransferase
MTDRRLDHDHWTSIADLWTAWARTPGHDAFWYYHEQLREFVGTGDGQALEIGCGEGRVSRELTALGYEVTATDTVAEFVDIAREAGSAHHYRVADATALPFAEASFDLVVAYNVLMDVEDFDAAVAEIARVLTHDGRAVISLVHPFTDRGRFTDDRPDAGLLVERGYFRHRRFNSDQSRDGLVMHWAGWSRPLRDYTASFGAHGLVVADLTEPEPSVDSISSPTNRWSGVPLFLWMILRHAPQTWG